MRLRVVVPVLLVGTLISVFGIGAALAAQEEGGKAKGNTGAENNDSQTFEYEGRPTAVNGYVDLGQQGSTSGDLFVFSDELYKTAQGDGQGSPEKVGQADGRCTLIDPGSERLMCTVVSSFENGTIVTEGVATRENPSSTSSVTGGTGEYRGVTGEATLDLPPAEGPHAIRFDLQRGSSTSRPDRETGQERTEGNTKASAEKAKGKARDQSDTGSGR